MKDMEPMLSAYLDGELTLAERQNIESQLACDPELRSRLEQLRALDQVLRTELPPPRLDVEQLLSQLEPLGLARVEARHDRPTRESRRPFWRAGLTISLAASVLLIVGVLIRTANEDEEVVSPTTMAQVVRLVGTVEVRSNHKAAWKSWTDSTPISLDQGAAIRTTPDSLCEILTQESATFRMNRNTELVMQRSDELELIRGELWCHSGTSPVRVQAVDSQAVDSENTTGPMFVSPPDTRTQFKIESEALRMGCVADDPVNVELPGQGECLMSPGEWVASSMSQRETETGQFDRIQETAWQLPLLIQRPTEDEDLHDFLFEMLAQLGRSKIQYLYEEQIRELGAAGTLPMLAFVKSEKSRTDPHVRQQAMRIIADLAPESTREDLIQLRVDSDPQVAELSRLALQRLDKQLK
ncbi:MAG: hypothetical protein JNL67_05300 [Planctomycetaceae bacterium]|nr:hypothetical protein [Planctomycetaceae bacterium]